MSEIDKLFQELRNENKKAFMPFVTAGDPNLEFTAELLKQLDAVGCHLVELGIPYSDPIADGPTIQASYTRALNGGTKLEAIFDTVSNVSAELTIPIVTMVSYAIVFRMGIESYLDRAISAGVSGLIVPDLPVDESAELAQKCAAKNVSLIQLITPTTPRERAIEIAKTTTGFIYYVSITGITGERTELPAELTDNLQWLREQTDLPICVGFGISGPEQIAALKPYCDGIIVGSAVVRRIAAASEGVSTTDAIADVIAFAKNMVAAVDR